MPLQVGFQFDGRGGFVCMPAPTPAVMVPTRLGQFASQADNLPRITSRGIRGEIQYEIDKYLGLSWVNRLAMRVRSDQELEEYAMLGAPPGWREKIGALLVKKLREYALTIRNRDYESTMAIPGKWIRRDKTAQVTGRIRDHARGLGDHDAIMLSTFISNGTGSTNGTAFDSHYFFDTDHSWGDSGTFINLVTASQCPYLDVSTATKPTAQEAAQAIVNVIAYMMSYCDDQGNKMNATAKEFTVMTGLDLAVPFTQAFTSKLVSTGTGVIENPLGSLLQLGSNINVTLEINPLLSSWTTTFDVYRTDAGFKPYIIQEEYGPISQVLDESSDHYIKEDELIFIFKKSGYWGYGAPYYAARATLS
jgi:hypothetical protein